MKDEKRSKAPKNRTIRLSDRERRRLRKKLIDPVRLSPEKDPPDGVVCSDYRRVIDRLPRNSVDLLVLDPPYNLKKNFNGKAFNRMPVASYTDYLRDIFQRLRPLLKETASIYICGEWYTSASIFAAASEFFIVRNRITWEREKGRGAKTNWKNAAEDIWFCTVSNEYIFNAGNVRLRRRVLAPYRTDGRPRDWKESPNGNYRDTAPSNIWTDITVPFWSMPENTDHPTQKSEKLLARLILAGTNPGDFILDPFLGSGATAVAARKLGRRCLGIETDEDYCLLAQYRLERAADNPEIQGYTDGVFWERNTLAEQIKAKSSG